MTTDQMSRNTIEYARMLAASLGISVSTESVEIIHQRIMTVYNTGWRDGFNHAKLVEETNEP